MNHTKPHKLFDHPLLGMAVSVLLVYFLYLILSLLHKTVYYIATGSSTTDQISNAVITIVSSLLYLLFHQLWFRGELKHFFGVKGLGRAVWIGSGILVVILVELILHIWSGEKIGNVLIAVILGIAPGINEEVAWRIIPVSIAMRQKEKKSVIWMAFLLPSLVFGLIHGINLLAGADLLSTLFQMIYAIGLGLIFAAIYLRTGNIWASMLLHSLVDIVAFLSADMQQSGGVLTTSADLSAYWLQMIFIVIFFVNALVAFRRSRREEIPAVWDRIWESSDSGNEQPDTEAPDQSRRD